MATNNKYKLKLNRKLFFFYSIVILGIFVIQTSGEEDTSMEFGKSLK